MPKINFDLSFIVPITHKIIPLHIKYEQKTLFEYLVMPWETGISKNIAFSASLERQSEKIDISKLRLVNSLNRMPVIIESMKIDGIGQDITSHAPDQQKYIYLDTFFKACNTQAKIYKIIGMPTDISLSHSYVCNGSLYVPKCDRHQSILSFNKENIEKFSFIIELFEDNSVDSHINIECLYDWGTIETKINHQKDIRNLHKSLAEHFDNFAPDSEEFSQETYQNEHISNSEIDSIIEEMKHFDVVKIEGLSPNLNFNTEEILYQNNAYYVHSKNQFDIKSLFSSVDINNKIIISFYKDDTFEPVLQKTYYGMQDINDKQKQQAS